MHVAHCDDDIKYSGKSNTTSYCWTLRTSDILKRSAVPLMSLFPYVLLWKLETHIFPVNVLNGGSPFHVRLQYYE